MAPSRCGIDPWKNVPPYVCCCPAEFGRSRWKDIYALLRRSTWKISPSRTAFQGHSRSSKPTWIEPLSTTSYQRSIATMCLSRTVSEINGDFSGKLRNFPTIGAFKAPLNKAPSLGVKKLEWRGYRAEKVVWRYRRASTLGGPTKVKPTYIFVCKIWMDR